MSKFCIYIIYFETCAIVFLGEKSIYLGRISGNTRFPNFPSKGFLIFLHKTYLLFLDNT